MVLTFYHELNSEMQHLGKLLFLCAFFLKEMNL